MSCQIDCCRLDRQPSRHFGSSAVARCASCYALSILPGSLMRCVAALGTNRCCRTTKVGNRTSMVPSTSDRSRSARRPGKVDALEQCAEPYWYRSSHEPFRRWLDKRCCQHNRWREYKLDAQETDPRWHPLHSPSERRCCLADRQRRSHRRVARVANCRRDVSTRACRLSRKRRPFCCVVALQRRHSRRCTSCSSLSNSRLCNAGRVHWARSHSIAPCPNSSRGVARPWRQCKPETSRGCRRRCDRSSCRKLASRGTARHDSAKAVSSSSSQWQQRSVRNQTTLSDQNSRVPSTCPKANGRAHAGQNVA